MVQPSSRREMPDSRERSAKYLARRPTNARFYIGTQQLSVRAELSLLNCELVAKQAHTIGSALTIHKLNTTFLQPQLDSTLLLQLFS